jgi:hypothetical protein
MNMLTALILSLALAAADPVAPPAKSAVETMDSKTKAERVAKVSRNLARDEKILVELTPQNIANTRTHNENAADGKVRERARCEAAIPQYRVELSWLKGELTPTNTEAAVKTAEDALAKAEKAKQPTNALKTALAKATAERDEVARLEAAEKPKDEEPH